MKEIIISIVIVIGILLSNGVTQNYTKNSTEEISKQLSNLKEEMMNENVYNEDVNNKINEIHEQWDKKYERLAYYIEHNELEKVESGLTLIRSYIETEEYTESIAKVDETMYLLRHISEKSKFEWKNIF